MMVHSMMHQEEEMGVGPRGLHVLSSCYVLVCESNVDAILVVDLEIGGVAGTIRLHSPNVSAWMAPTVLSTCTDCDFLYVVGIQGVFNDDKNDEDPNPIHYIHKIHLPTTWQSMLDTNDFSALTQVDPSRDMNHVQMNQDERMDGPPRTITMTQNGSVAYLVHSDSGVWKIQHDSDLSSSTSTAIPYMDLATLGTLGDLEDAFLTPDQERLIVTSQAAELVVIDLIKNQIDDLRLLLVDTGCVGENLHLESWVGSMREDYA